MSQPKPHLPYPSQLASAAQLRGAEDPLFILTQKILDGVDPRAIEDLQEKYKAEMAIAKPSGPPKYLDVPLWTLNKAQLAGALGLDTAPPLSILDLGAGACHFSRVCHYFGHSTVAVDIEVPLYEDIAGVLGVQRTIHTVEPGVALPDFGRRFDLVTAVAINFHRIVVNVSYWSLEQWKFLFNDLVSNQLRFPGRLYFELNREFRGGELVINSELIDYCASNGAEITKGYAIDWRFPEFRHLP